jgi:peptidoglycan/LPS O-acetylase OafA/YrhL
LNRSVWQYAACALIAIAFFATGSWYVLSGALLILYLRNYEHVDLNPVEREVRAGSIASHSGTRDNNFNLIRILATLTVVLHHSYALLAVPQGSAAPRLVGVVANNALHLFFIVSGYLIAKSFVRRPVLRDFLNARILRLIPALFVVTSLTAFVLGPAVTTVPLGQYLADGETWAYVLTNSSLEGAEFLLPGVFKDNIYPGAVNGSIWTLKYEGKMYATLALLGLLGAFGKGSRFLLFSMIFLAWYFAVDWFPELFEKASRFDHLTRLSMCFFVGAFFYRVEHWMPLRASYAAVGLALAALLSNVPMLESFAHPARMFALGYATLWVALCPKGWLLEYNRLGDYSYGLYIYAFPVQQTLVWLDPDLSLSEMLIFATAISMFFAVISWHVLEKPMLSFARTSRSQPGTEKVARPRDPQLNPDPRSA